ncbi:hypothetical protein UB33_05950 [Photobacterium angustum]|nr:hypothetical protein UB33_05950 [Photobacterium angustum]
MYTMLRGWTFDANHIVMIVAPFMVFTLLYTLIECSDYKQIAKYILSLSFLVSLFAIYQELTYIFLPYLYIDIHSLPGFIGGTDKSNLFNVNFIRVYGFSTEPAHFAFLIFPALLMCFETILFKKNNIAVSKFEFLVIFSAFILTFSTVAYLCLFLYLSFKLMQDFNFKGKILLLLFFVVLIYIGYSNDAVYSKITRLIYSTNLYDSSGTVYAILSSIKLALFSIKENLLLFGVGINNYRNLYDDFYINPIEVINRVDGASMYLRMVVELGLFLSSIFITYFVYLIYKGRHNFYTSVFGFALICYCIRTGNYASPLFLTYLAFFCLSLKNRDMNVITR